MPEYITINNQAGDDVEEKLKLAMFKAYTEASRRNLNVTVLDEAFDRKS